jgi:DEAD/DEAH box helicase domain-containing protein
VAETATLLADLAGEQVRTVAFVRSRRGAELVSVMAREDLARHGGASEKIAAYRAGYLREERRALEAALQSGKLTAIAATNALELGVDIAGLDAVLLAGYPGTRASLWQQAGRAGRSGQEALAVLIARDDPLDTYLVHHPEALFGKPVEATVFDPGNPYVLWGHLCAAASELPLREKDMEPLRPGHARTRGRAGQLGLAAQAGRRLVLDPPRTCGGPERSARDGRRADPDHRGGHRKTPRHGRRRLGGRARCTRERCTCTRARATSYGNWTWTPR